MIMEKDSMTINLAVGSSRRFLEGRMVVLKRSILGKILKSPRFAIINEYVYSGSELWAINVTYLDNPGGCELSSYDEQPSKFFKRIESVIVTDVSALAVYG